MTRDDALLRQGLEWVARLPLVGELELAGLLGVAPEDARGLLHGLTKLGWVESVEPGSPELEPRRLWLVRDAALPALSEALGLSPSELTQAVPVRLRDGFERIARVGLTAGVNRFFANLASDLRRSGIGQLADARSLPTALSSRERWWLPHTDGYGCLRAGTLRAPFLLAWDRAGAPDVYRRRRVARWRAGSRAVGAQWGNEGLPTLLLVSPTERQGRVWEQALLARDTESASTAVDVLLTTRDRLRADGPGGMVWRAPGRDRVGLLVELVGWGTEPTPAPAIRLGRPLAETPEPPQRTGPSIREWAAVHATVRSDAPTWQRLAVLALATGPEEQRLLEWVARHPLVSAAELASLGSTPAGLISRRLEGLVRCGALTEESTPPLGHGDDAARSGMDQDHDGRYVLTDLGMRLLAAQAAVPPTTFAAHGGVTCTGADAPATSERALWHREHSVGVNRFVAQLARDARRAGWRLAEWRNEAESTQRWVDRDGRTVWIRPDSSGVLQHEQRLCCFLLEYDRGTLDAADYRAKFDGYRRHFAEREWEKDFDCEPLLLFACSDATAEGRVVRVARRYAPDLAMLATNEQRYESGDATGVWGVVWRDQHDSRRLHAFLTPGTDGPRHPQQKQAPVDRPGPSGIAQADPQA